MLIETTDQLALVTLDALDALDAKVVTDARRGYPGHLPVQARLYADAWAEVAARDG